MGPARCASGTTAAPAPSLRSSCTPSYRACSGLLTCSEHVVVRVLVLGDNTSAQDSVHLHTSSVSIPLRSSLLRWFEHRFRPHRLCFAGRPLCFAKAPGGSANPADPYARRPLLASSPLAPLDPSRRLLWSVFPLPSTLHQHSHSILPTPSDSHLSSKSLLWESLVVRTPLCLAEPSTAAPHLLCPLPAVICTCCCHLLAMPALLCLCCPYCPPSFLQVVTG